MYSDPSTQDYLGSADNGPSEEGGKFVPSKKVLQLKNRLVKFMEDHIYPMENEFYKLAQSTQRWTVHPEEENLKELAKKEGLWNLFIPVRIYLYTYHIFVASIYMSLFVRLKMFSFYVSSSNFLWWKTVFFLMILFG